MPDVLTSEFWIKNTANVDEQLLSAEQISEMNERSFATATSLADLRAFPAVLSASELTSLIRRISRIPTETHYYRNGVALQGDDYARYEAGLNLPCIAETNPVRFGLIVRRTSMRRFPTDDIVSKTTAPQDFDRFQENGLFPTDRIAVLHRSKDGNWLLAQSYNYLGWVHANAVATGERDRVLESPESTDFLLVTGAKIHTASNPECPQTSGIQLDMSIRLPRWNEVSAVSASARSDNHVVELPVRDVHGELQFAPALIPKDADVHSGFLSYTRSHVIRQAFCFLGEVYGWGHSRNSRDCSGFVAEIYRTFGIYLPRNSDDQGASPIGENLRFTDDSTSDQKRAALQSLQAGDLVYTPGHVMLYLGAINGEPYVIHDASALNYMTGTGSFVRNAPGGVSVSPFLQLHSDESLSHLQAMTGIKRIR
ncbi:MAG: NlpC/P60 family protein [Woeseia sp.]